MLVLVLLLVLLMMQMMLVLMLLSLRCHDLIVVEVITARRIGAMGRKKAMREGMLLMG